MQNRFVSKAKKKYYIVKRGRTPGVYYSWPECQKEVQGFPGAVFKEFSTKEKAEAWYGAAEEYFSPKQKGSSAMPHKRNPVKSERICGMARLIQGYSLPAFENIPLWHERDISHSSVERVMLPDATIALDYILSETTSLIDKLLVYPEKMMDDLNLTGGLIYSPRVLLALVAKGAYRDTAYRWVQRNAMKRWLDGEDFYENLCKDEDVRKYLTPEEIKACFDYQPMLKHVDDIFARFGL